MFNPMFKKVISICCLSLLGASPVLQAAPVLTPRPMIIPAPPQLAAKAYLLMDADSGKILVEENADLQLPPASLTKMMTSYIVSAEIARGDVKETDLVPISVNAWKMGGSKMFVQEGTQVPVSDLLRGVIVQSGNDATVALAEFISGSEGAFADVMNQQAALLGMTNTTFHNATGWPVEGHLTTARDLAILARALINDFPEHYELYSEKSFTYNNITQSNRNRLLFRDPKIDGLKTGHTEEAGFCLVASGKQGDMRLISVVLGTRSDEARAAESQKLLSYGFRYFETHKLYAAGQVLNESRVWGGQENSVQLGLAKPLVLTIPRGGEDKLDAKLVIDETLKAPIEAGQKLGTLTVSLDDEVLSETPLVALQPVEEAGFLARMWDAIKLFFLNLFS